MNVVIRQGKSHEYGGDAKQLLKGVNDRDGSAGAHEYWRCAEALAICGNSRLHCRMPTIEQSGLGPTVRTNRGTHGRWSDTGNVLTNKLLDLVRVLVRHESEVEFCCGTRGNDCFDSWPLITSSDACDT